MMQPTAAAGQNPLSVALSDFIFFNLSLLENFKAKVSQNMCVKDHVPWKDRPPYKTSTWSSFPRQNISWSWCHWRTLCELPKCSALWSTPNTPWTTMAASHNYNVEFLKSKIHKKSQYYRRIFFRQIRLLQITFLCETRKCVVWPS